MSFLPKMCTPPSLHLLSLASLEINVCVPVRFNLAPDDSKSLSVAGRAAGRTLTHISHQEQSARGPAWSHRDPREAAVAESPLKWSRR